MSPDLSIVVVHWNVAELLRGCLASIVAELDRSGLDAQVVVVDCASPDPGYREIVADFPDMQLVELATNRGYAAGCNEGIRRTSGELVLLLNPDLVLLPDVLTTLVSTAQVATHLGMVAPLLLNPDGSIQSAGYRFPGIANVFFDLFPLHPRLTESPLNGRVPLGEGALPIQIDYPLGAAMLVRRAALDDVGLLDESYGMYSEEIDLARRLADAGWTTLLAPSARMIHYGGQSTGQRPDAMHEALWLSRARYYSRYGSLAQRRVISRIVDIGLRRADRRASPERRAANARIRQRFRQIASDR